MKTNKLLITTLLIFALLGFSVFLTACLNEDEEVGPEDVPEVAGGAMIMTVTLPSDSENGSEWVFEQDGDLFTCEEAFLDNGSDDSSAEAQSFQLIPESAGTTKVSFTNQTEDTTYTYECEISEDLTDITINKSEGVKAGETVEAPTPVLERD